MKRSVPAGEAKQVAQQQVASGLIGVHLKP